MGLLALALACANPVPQVGAHRGLTPGQPENTLAAFHRAIDTGVQIIELDLRSTRDGGIVVMHDATVDRTTDGTGAVGQMSLAEVRALDAGRKAGAAFAGERVPDYDEVLALASARPVRLLLDIKDGGSLDLGDVIGRAKARGVADRIVIGVRRPEDLRAVRAIDPAIATLAFVASRSDIDDFIDGGADMIRLWSDWIETDPSLAGRVRKRGRKLWIVVGRNPPRGSALEDLHRRLRCMDVDAIITDWPNLLTSAEADGISR